MTMTMHKAEKINPNVCCNAGREIAIAQATSITRTKTACLPDQRNIDAPSQASLGPLDDIGNLIREPLPALSSLATLRVQDTHNRGQVHALRA
jgi:hypothetical protein